VYTLDTNAIIYYTNDEPAAVSVLEPIFEQDAPIFVSTITVMELFSYPALTDEEEARLNRVLSTTRIEPFSVGIARLAGDLRRLYPSLKPLDSGIAATSLYMNSTLATRNVRDFQRIEELSLLEI
jgi:predicted nucleic acid-binding protein